MLPMPVANACCHHDHSLWGCVLLCGSVTVIIRAASLRRAHTNSHTHAHNYTLASWQRKGIRTPPCMHTFASRQAHICPFLPPSLPCVFDAHMYARHRMPRTTCMHARTDVHPCPDSSRTCSSSAARHGHHGRDSHHTQASRMHTRGGA